VGARKIDAVLSLHMNPLSCGVAKFNALLAEELNVPMYGLWSSQPQHPLVSLKLSELKQVDRTTLHEAVSGFRPPPDTCYRHHSFDLFLHDWEESLLCDELTRQARRVFAANAWIADQCEGAVALFCPSTLTADMDYADSPVTTSVFVCGMAHKIQAEHHKKLKTLLEAAGEPYQVNVSAAFHEDLPAPETMKALREEFQAIYGDKVRFLGFLSDAGTIAAMKRHTYTALFYEDGLRENNTMAQAALKHGNVLITNLDEWSPRREDMYFLDICELEQLQEQSRRDMLRKRARMAADTYSWDRLTEALR
jgi:hypothetical protein